MALEGDTDFESKWRRVKEMAMRRIKWLRLLFQHVPPELWDREPERVELSRENHDALPTQPQSEGNVQNGERKQTFPSSNREC